MLVNYAFKLGLPVFIAENGFLRGVHFFTKKTKDDPFTDGYSFIVDRSQYYDATCSNSIEDDLNNLQITQEQRQAASHAVAANEF